MLRTFVRLSTLVGVILLASLSSVAPAHASERLWRDSADTAAFNAQVARLREQMQPDERFGAISDADRQKVEDNIEVLRKLFDLRGSVAGMKDEERVVVLNAQETINALLEGNDGDRMVCQREAQIGTRFKSTVCMTARERASRKKDASEVVRKNQYHTDTKADRGG
ncbi:MAG: hypothetical protein DWB45_05925 [Xanthomonadales bacterium]|nr:hypothetical protein [Xanthomonadales bacterium]MDL1869542.1 hypothetical protein [Gammaproteobacteria bacterium PRO6]